MLSPMRLLEEHDGESAGIRPALEARKEGLTFS